MTVSNEAKGILIYSSISQCAASQGISKTVIRAAKAKGAPGFIGHRVNWTLLKPWMDEHKSALDVEDIDNYQKWRTKRERHEANIAEIKELEARGKFLLKEEVESQIKAIALAQKAILKSRLTQELPPKLLGLSVTEIGVIMDECVHDICRLMEQLKIR